MTPKQLFARIWNMISHGAVTGTDDAGGVLKLQVKIGYMELHDNRVAVQQFGLSSVPPVGSDVTLLFIGGDRSNGLVIGTNHQGSRPTGRNPGETTLFNNFGMSIFMSENGIVIDGGGKPVHFTNGDLHVDGNIIWDFAGTPTTAKTHEHDQGDDTRGDSEQRTTPPVPGT